MIKIVFYPRAGILKVTRKIYQKFGASIEIAQKLNETIDQNSLIREYFNTQYIQKALESKNFNKMQFYDLANILIYMQSLQP